MNKILSYILIIGGGGAIAYYLLFKKNNDQKLVDLFDKQQKDKEEISKIDADLGLENDIVNLETLKQNNAGLNNQFMDIKIRESDIDKESIKALLPKDFGKLDLGAIKPIDSKFEFNATNSLEGLDMDKVKAYLEGKIVLLPNKNV
jgi:hypothetical protein